MASPEIPQSLRGLVLSAAELQQMTNWPDALIEDYLSLIDNLVVISEVVNQKTDTIRTVTAVDFSMSPYQILDVEDEIFFDTDAGDIDVNLPTGQEGRTFRLVNVGAFGNRVNLIPDPADFIFGAVSEYLADQEAFILTYSLAKGWN
jgi:hypothetical protein